MKKLILLFILIISICIIFNVSFVYAEDKNIFDYVNENIEKIDMKDLENIINEDSEINISLKQLINKIISGEYDSDINSIIKQIQEIVKNELLSFIPMIFSILSVVLLYSILKNLSNSFLNKEINSLIHFVCFSAVLLIVSTQITMIISSIKNLIDQIGKYSDVSFPILMNVMILLGSKVSSSVYSPYCELFSTTIIKVIQNVVFPLSSASIIVQIVSNISDKIKLNKLSKVLLDMSKYILTTMFSLFIVFLSFQGLTSGIIDTISIKSAKYAIENYVPIIGGYLSDGYDLVLFSFVLIKNSLGYIVLIYFLKVILVPIIKILVLTISLRVSAAVIEPLSENKISDFLFKISKNVMMFIAIVLAISFMFIISIMFIILSCNIGA